ncbi:hypothetical protein [Oceanobacillus sp. FSL K6-0251]|uniref:hypothetical protein n=1 Tax=Oceanobacillus sp. FSL K6-0251 TaxID=2921602 RepID=UPI0030FCE4F0
MEMNMVIPKFYESLERYSISYDEKTGELSDTLIFIVFESHRKLPVDRVLIFKDYFLFIDDEKKESRKVFFKQIKGYKKPDDYIEIK